MSSSSCMRARSMSVGTFQPMYSSVVLLVTVTSPTVDQLATQLRISSCHQRSHGVDRSSREAGDAARFMAGSGCGQSVDQLGSRSSDEKRVFGPVDREPNAEAC
jgi:hypothetical protein